MEMSLKRWKLRGWDFTKAVERVILPHTVHCHRIQQRSTACHCTLWHHELTWPLATCKEENADSNISSAAAEGLQNDLRAKNAHVRRRKSPTQNCFCHAPSKHFEGMY